jgi:3-phenylpropionate/trans-cinnamate dioxygenase ferredoxin reductase subunit
VQNATDQAQHAAAVLVGQEAGGYRGLPWFWSHQGSTKIQIAGLRAGATHTMVPGDRAYGRFSAFAFDTSDGSAALVAVESANSPADHLAAPDPGGGRPLSPGIWPIPRST